MEEKSFDVTVVGSCMIDLIWYSSRLPKKGETLHGQKFEMGHGGKGANQVVAAAKLGAFSALVARLGNDVFGRKYLESLKNFNVDTRHVSLTPGHSSGMAQITVTEDGDNSIIIVAGANNELSSDDIKSASDTLLRSKVVVFQMETPLSTTLDALRLISESEKGPVTILNAAPAILHSNQSALFKLCDILCVNETEAELLTGLPVNSVEQAKATSKKLIELGCRKVIVTLGSQGVVFQEDAEPWHVDVEPLKPVDTTGAGDCFVGALAFYLSRLPHLPMKEQIRRASAIASRSVLKKGTQTRKNVMSNPYMFQNPHSVSDFYLTHNLPERFQFPHRFQGFGCQRPQENLLYRTTYGSTYGYWAPSIHTVPTRYYPLSQKFTSSLANFGMYRNYSLNT